MAKVFQVTDPQKIKALMASVERGDVHVAKVTSGEGSVSTKEALVFHVQNRDDFRVVAEYFGVEITPGRGRYPTTRLAEAVAEAGHVLDTSQYGRPVSSIVGSWQVSLLEQVGSDVYPRTGLVSVDQVRSANPRKGRRGRFSKDDIVKTAMSVHGWGDTYILDSLNVQKVD